MLSQGFSQVCSMAALSMMAPAQNEAGNPIGLMGFMSDYVGVGIGFVALVHDDEAPAQSWPTLQVFMLFCFVSGKKKLFQPRCAESL